MLLTIDVGNTNIVAALYENDNLRRHWRMATDKNKASDEYGMLITQFLLNEGVKPDEIDDVMIASVVPTVMHSLTNGVKRYLDCTPMVVGPGIKTGMNIRMDNPRELGADRIVNAVAAIHKYKPPLVIVDFWNRHHILRGGQERKLCRRRYSRRNKIQWTRFLKNR